MKKEFKFSVVIPIYNVGLYLDETIKSVINQTIGFKDNIELILVNDGSKDNSEKICLKYQKKYPNNIKYLSFSNSGVSHARNEGLKVVTGKYLNFLDGDDLWDSHVFERVYSFFEDNYKDIDIVSARQKFFDRKKTYHPLDFKYKKGNRIIDIFKDPNYIQMSVASSFIKTEVAKKYSFDTKLKYGEDAKYITQIILEKEKYGVMSDILYKIRRRKNETSATEGKTKNIASYMPVVDNYYSFLYDYSMKKYNEFILYTQYALLNALKFRVGAKIPDNILTNEEKDEYIKKIIDLIKKIDDEVICNTDKVNVDTKLYILKLKHGDIEKNVFIKDDKIYFNNLKIDNIVRKATLKINNIKLSLSKIKIKGIIKLPLYFEFNELYLKIKNKKYVLNLKDNNKLNRKSFLNEDMNNVKKFACEIPIFTRFKNLNFYLKYNNKNIKIYFNKNIKSIIKKIIK